MFFYTAGTSRFSCWFSSGFSPAFKLIVNGCVSVRENIYHLETAKTGGAWICVSGVSRCGWGTADTTGRIIRKVFRCLHKRRRVKSHLTIRVKPMRYRNCKRGDLFTVRAAVVLFFFLFSQMGMTFWGDRTSFFPILLFHWFIGITRNPCRDWPPRLHQLIFCRSPAGTMVLALGHASASGQGKSDGINIPLSILSRCFRAHPTPSELEGVFRLAERSQNRVSTTPHRK